ncbi:hypothetical protein [Psittacicella gerlachiana]|uniref:Uncharacterized protein n=1 Tax=Psittacicella gerlachiana TaxID=2028574 RepID=A0A3A1Y3B7_9GAMM|nr:hypothetical protein [Psittacicella gerlachiana]RIY31708.1 hypothetical protein CKF59_07465 [Psittacicella gerlachiana]
MDNEINFSEQNLESLSESHVYVPDTINDYRSYHTGKSIKTIGNPHKLLKTKVVNKVNLPPFCTATGNPGSGSYLTISYTAKDKLLEVFTFEKYINSFIGHPIVRDVELLAQEVATEVAIALNTPVTLTAEFVLVGFKYGQSVQVEVEIDQYMLQILQPQYREKYLAFLEKQAKGEIKVLEDNKTFLERVAQNQQATCPVKHTLQSNQDSNPLEKEQAVESVKEEKQEASIQVESQEKARVQEASLTSKEDEKKAQSDDYEVCPFVKREDARPGSKCPVTGKSY